MRKALLALMPLALAGCVVQYPNHTGSYVPRDHNGPYQIRFGVSLAGQPCEDVPSVISVRVQIQDPVNGNVDTEVSCPATADPEPQEIIVPGFASGSYPFTLTALDANGLSAYVGSGTADVNGASLELSVDLTPVSGQGRIDFTWAFGQDGLRCADVGVTDVVVTLGEISTSVPCSPESAVEGHSFDVPAGAYTWSLSAVGSSGRKWLASGGPVQVAASSDLEVQAELDPKAIPTTGTLLVTWTFAGSPSCPRSQEITHLYIDVWKGSTKVVDHQSVECLPGGAQVDLDPGSYTVDLAGYNVDEMELYEALGAQATVVAGQETDLKVDLRLL